MTRNVTFEELFGPEPVFLDHMFQECMPEFGGQFSVADLRILRLGLECSSVVTSSREVASAIAWWVSNPLTKLLLVHVFRERGDSKNPIFSNDGSPLRKNHQIAAQLFLDFLRHDEDVLKNEYGIIRVCEGTGSTALLAEYGSFVTRHRSEKRNP